MESALFPNPGTARIWPTRCCPCTCAWRTPRSISRPSAGALRRPASPDSRVLRWHDFCNDYDSKDPPKRFLCIPNSSSRRIRPLTFIDYNSDGSREKKGVACAGPGRRCRRRSSPRPSPRTSAGAGVSGIGTTPCCVFAHRALCPLYLEKRRNFQLA